MFLVRGIGRVNGAAVLSRDKIDISRTGGRQVNDRGKKTLTDNLKNDLES